MRAFGARCGLSGAQAERLDAIRSHLYTHGFSTIQALADAVGASLATIRRDLAVLEREGAIDRVHGGARIAEGSSVEMAFQERAKRNLAAKRSIAAAAYELLVPHATVFLDAGTTVLQLARLIRVNLMHRREIPDLISGPPKRDTRQLGFDLLSDPEKTSRHHQLTKIKEAA